MTKNNLVILLFFVLGVTPYSISQMRILLTAALSDNYFEFRKQQYIRCLNILAGYGYSDLYIVEALKKQGPTFLDDYSKNVFYATTNNPGLRNKGINEARTLLEAVNYFNFAPEDMIVKLTGRYELCSDYWLNLIQDNPEYDAVIKIEPISGQVYTAAFAMRCIHFKEMFEVMDYDALERDFINLERKVADYIYAKQRQGNFNVLCIHDLSIRANVFGSSVSTGAPDQYIYF